MTTKPNRHTMIEAICQLESCGIRFMARKQRVDKGQSRFCSMENYREYQKSIGSQRKNIGKENAIILFNEEQKMYKVFWYEPDTMKYKTSTWGKWAWELNFGNIPKGYVVGYRDGNSRNNTLENLVLQSPEDIGVKIRALSKGRTFSDEHKQALRIGRTGMKLSKEHRQHIGDATRMKWNKGMFDSVHVGEHNHHWRGGVKYTDYPLEFHKIKHLVRERDNNMCQICGKSVYRSRHGHVHHIDGNKKDNSLDNLILVCTTCHGKIHAQNPAPPPILAFRALLYWNQEIEHGLPNPLNFPEER